MPPRAQRADTELPTSPLATPQQTDTLRSPARPPAHLLKDVHLPLGLPLRQVALHDLHHGRHQARHLGGGQGGAKQLALGGGQGKRRGMGGAGVGKLGQVLGRGDACAEARKSWKMIEFHDGHRPGCWHTCYDRSTRSDSSIVLLCTCGYATMSVRCASALCSHKQSWAIASSRSNPDSMCTAQYTKARAWAPTHAMWSGLFLIMDAPGELSSCTAARDDSMQVASTSSLWS